MVFAFHKLSFFTRLKGSDASWEHDEEPPPEVNEIIINYIFNYSCIKIFTENWLVLKSILYILLNVLKFFLNLLL